MADGIPAIFEGETNISLPERAGSVAVGLALAAAAAKPRPNPALSLVALAAGAYLALRGATGHCPIKAAFTGAPETPVAP